jgi:hypothetical protein
MSGQFFRAKQMIGNENLIGLKGQLTSFREKSDINILGPAKARDLIKLAAHVHFWFIVT